VVGGERSGQSDRKRRRSLRLNRDRRGDRAERIEARYSDATLRVKRGQRPWHFIRDSPNSSVARCPSNSRRWGVCRHPASWQESACVGAAGTQICSSGWVVPELGSARHVVRIADLEWCSHEGLGPVEHARRLHVRLEVCLVRPHRSPTLDHHEPVRIIVPSMDVKGFESIPLRQQIPDPAARVLVAHRPSPEQLRSCR
jgi:hypothetical protein